MRDFGRLLVAACCLAGSATATSQDLFSSTNSTVRSYNYAEIQYLLDVDSSPPVLATVLLDVKENWSLTAQYLNTDFGDITDQVELNPDDIAILAVAFGVEPGDITINAELTGISAGVLYHQPFTGIPESDWIAGLMLGRTEINFDAPAIQLKGKIKDNFQEVFAGVRRTFSPKLEGEATISVNRDDDDTDVSANVKLVYRLLESIDIAFAGSNLGGSGDDVLGVGLRYAW